MANFQQALVTELSAVAGLSGKVFPHDAPEGTAAPYLTYGKTGTDHIRVLGVNSYNGNVFEDYTLNILHSTYSNAEALARLVHAELLTFIGTTIGATGPTIQDLKITNETDYFESEIKLYRMIIEFRVYYLKT